MEPLFLLKLTSKQNMIWTLGFFFEFFSQLILTCCVPSPKSCQMDSFWSIILQLHVLGNFTESDAVYLVQSPVKWTPFVHTLAKARVDIKRIDRRPWYTTYWPQPLWEPPPKFSQITEFRFFEKIPFFNFRSQNNQLFSFWGGPKKFFWTSIPFLASKFMVSRGSNF